MLVATVQFQLMLYGAYRGRENLDKIKLTDFKIVNTNVGEVLKEMPNALNTFMKPVCRECHRGRGRVSNSNQSALTGIGAYWAFGRVSLPFGGLPGNCALYI